MGGFSPTYAPRFLLVHDHVDCKDIPTYRGGLGLEKSNKKGISTK